MSMSTDARMPVAVQRCDTFVGRTMNWLYDHLRRVPRYSPVVFCDTLANREEFPELRAWTVDESLSRRVWRRISDDRLYPLDRRRLSGFCPAVLHSHFGYVAVEDHRWKDHLSVPWVVSFYGADVYMLGRLAEWQDRYFRLFEAVDRVLALGPSMAEALAGLGCHPDKIELHPLGVDVQEIPSAPRQLSAGEPLQILFAGTLREKKGVQYLIEAVHLARRSGVRLTLHLVGDIGGREGDVETRQEVFRLIAKHGLEHDVRHYSWLPFSELLDLSLRCHVFVAPSLTAADGDAEGTPFVIQQMMATGMPVVSTRHSDIPYLFGPFSGSLVPERDAVSLANRLRSYAETPSRIIEDGAALNAHIRQEFDVRSCAARLAERYTAVSESPRLLSGVGA